MAARARPDVPSPEGPPLSAQRWAAAIDQIRTLQAECIEAWARPAPRDPGRLAGPPSSSRRCATSTSTPSTSTRLAASAATDAPEPHPSSRPTTSRTSTPSRFSEARSTSTSTVPSADSRPPRRNVVRAERPPGKRPSGRTGGRADVVARPPAHRGRLDRARCARLAVAALCAATGTRAQAGKGTPHRDDGRWSGAGALWGIPRGSPSPRRRTTPGRSTVRSPPCAVRPARAIATKMPTWPHRIGSVTTEPGRGRSRTAIRSCSQTGGANRVNWAAEETDHPREVVDAALAHVVHNRVEAAYARSDLFERGRRLTDEELSNVVDRPLT